MNSDEWSIQSAAANLRVPLFSRLVLLSCTGPFLSKLCSVTMLILSHIQMLFIIIKATLFGLGKEFDDFVPTLKTLFKVLYEDYSTSLRETYLALFGVLTFYWIAVFLAFTYLYVCLYNNLKCFNFVQKAVSFILKLQSSILFYPIHFLSLKILISLVRTQVPDSLLYWFSFGTIFINVIWSFVIVTFFATNVQTKEFTSTKTNKLSVLNLCYSFILPIIWIIAEDSKAYQVLALVLTLAYCLFRCWGLYHFLPYYKIALLNLEAFVNSIFLGISTASIVCRLSSSLRTFDSSDLYILLSIIFSIIYSRIFSKLLADIFVRMLLHPKESRNFYHVLHYLKVAKLFSEGLTSKFVWAQFNNRYLYYMSFLKNSEMQNLLPVEMSQGWTLEIQLQVKQYFRKSYLELLERIVKRNPQNLLVKACLANHYLKNERFWILANHMIDELAHKSFLIRNSVSYIQAKILYKMKLKKVHIDQLHDHNGFGEQNSLEIQKYLRIKETSRALRVSIMEQLNYQVQFWKEFQRLNPMFLTLKRLAKKVQEKATAVTNFAKQRKDLIENKIQEPLLILGLYFFFIQNDIDQGKKFIQDYHKIQNNSTRGLAQTIDFKRKLVSRSLCLTLSMTPQSIGTILECSGKVTSILGTDKQALMGKSINTLLPTVYVKFHDEFLKASSKEKITTAHKDTPNVFIMTQQKYILCCQLQLTLTHLADHGLCYSAILKPSEDKRRLVLIRDDGVIANYSRRFEKDMKLDLAEKSVLNIYDHCFELKRILDDLATDNSTSLQSKKDTKNTSNKSYDKYTTKEFLTFFPVRNPKISFIKHSPTRKIITPILYEAEINLLVIQNHRVIELRMKKANNAGVMSRSSFRSFIPESSMVNSPLIQHLESASNNNLTEIFSVRSSDHLNSGHTPIHSPLIPFKKSIFNFYQQTEDKNLTAQDEICFKLKERESEAYAKSDNESYNFEGIFEGVRVSHPSQGIIANKLGMGNPLGDQIDEENVSNESSIHQKTSIAKEAVAPLKVIHQSLIKQVLTEVHTERHTLSGFESTREIKAHQVIRKIIESREYRPSTKRYINAFTFTFLVLMVFMIWLNIFTSTSSRNIENLSEVVTSIFFRSYWSKIAHQETRIWVAKELGLFDFPISVTIASNNKSYQALSSFNQNLSISTGKLDLETEKLFNIQDIRVYERNQNNDSELIANNTAFQLVNQLVNNGLTNVNKAIPSVLSEGSYNEGTRFIFNNSCNDLIFSSDRLSGIIQSNLLRSLSSSKITMEIALYLILTVLLLFLLLSLVFVIHLNKGAKKLMDILCHILPQEVQNIEELIVRFKELLEKDSSCPQLLKAFNLSYEEINPMRPERSSKSSAKRRKSKKTPLMKGYNLRNYLLFLGIVVAFGLMILFTLTYYTRAIDKIITMEQQHTSINSGLTYLNALALTSVETLSMVLDNGTSIIKNLPVFTALSQDINSLKNINEYQHSLWGSKGFLSDYQHEVFYNMSCEQVFSPLYSVPQVVTIPDCISISSGLQRIGLINSLSQLTTTLTGFVIDFLNSDRGDLDIKEFYQSFFDDILPIINVSSVLFLLSFSATTNDFQELVKELEGDRIVFGWTASLIAVISGAVTWFCLVRRLSKREFGIKKILSLFPGKLILSNYDLKKCVYTFSSKRDVTIQNILNI